jgi:hypothetical protein
MGAAVSEVRSSLGPEGTPEPPRELLERGVGHIVATFDGVMRQMVHIVGSNVAAYIESGGEPSNAFPLLPAGISFQSLEPARQKLVSSAGFDRAGRVQDWPQLVRLFQKRHLLAHRLGVVDEEYVKKTGDQGVQIGRLVPLSRLEITRGATDCLEIVIGFFGQLLS